MTPSSFGRFLSVVRPVLPPLVARSSKDRHSSGGCLQAAPLRVFAARLRSLIDAGCPLVRLLEGDAEQSARLDAPTPVMNPAGREGSEIPILPMQPCVPTLAARRSGGANHTAAALLSTCPALTCHRLRRLLTGRLVAMTEDDAADVEAALCEADSGAGGRAVAVESVLVLLSQLAREEAAAMVPALLLRQSLHTIGGGAISSSRRSRRIAEALAGEPTALALPAHLLWRHCQSSAEGVLQAMLLPAPAGDAASVRDPHPELASAQAADGDDDAFAGDRRGRMSAHVSLLAELLLPAGGEVPMALLADSKRSKPQVSAAALAACATRAQAHAARLLLWLASRLHLAAHARAPRSASMADSPASFAGLLRTPARPDAMLAEATPVPSHPRVPHSHRSASLSQCRSGVVPSAVLLSAPDVCALLNSALGRAEAALHSSPLDDDGDEAGTDLADDAESDSASAALRAAESGRATGPLQVVAPTSAASKLTAWEAAAIVDLLAADCFSAVDATGRAPSWRPAAHPAGADVRPAAPLVPFASLSRCLRLCAEWLDSVSRRTCAGVGAADAAGAALAERLARPGAASAKRGALPADPAEASSGKPTVTVDDAEAEFLHRLRPGRAMPALCLVRPEPIDGDVDEAHGCLLPVDQPQAQAAPPASPTATGELGTALVPRWQVLVDAKVTWTPAAAADALSAGWVALADTATGQPADLALGASSEPVTLFLLFADVSRAAGHPQAHAAWSPDDAILSLAVLPADSASAGAARRAERAGELGFDRLTDLPGAAVLWCRRRGRRRRVMQGRGEWHGADDAEAGTAGRAASGSGDGRGGEAGASKPLPLWECWDGITRVSSSIGPSPMASHASAADAASAALDGSPRSGARQTRLHRQVSFRYDEGEASVARPAQIRDAEWCKPPRPLGQATLPDSVSSAVRSDGAAAPLTLTGWEPAGGFTVPAAKRDATAGGLYMWVTALPPPTAGEAASALWAEQRRRAAMDPARMAVRAKQAANQAAADATASLGAGSAAAGDASKAAGAVLRSPVADEAVTGDPTAKAGSYEAASAARAAPPAEAESAAMSVAAGAGASSDATPGDAGGERLSKQTGTDAPSGQGDGRLDDAETWSEAGDKSPPAAAGPGEAAGAGAGSAGDGVGGAGIAAGGTWELVTGDGDEAQGAKLALLVRPVRVTLRPAVWGTISRAAGSGMALAVVSATGESPGSTSDRAVPLQLDASSASALRLVEMSHPGAADVSDASRTPGLIELPSVGAAPAAEGVILRLSATNPSLESVSAESAPLSLVQLSKSKLCPAGSGGDSEPAALPGLRGVSADLRQGTGALGWVPLMREGAEVARCAVAVRLFSWAPAPAPEDREPSGAAGLAPATDPPGPVTTSDAASTALPGFRRGQSVPHAWNPPEPAARALRRMRAIHARALQRGTAPREPAWAFAVEDDAGTGRVSRARFRRAVMRRLHWLATTDEELDAVIAALAGASSAAPSLAEAATVDTATDKPPQPAEAADADPAYVDYVLFLQLLEAHAEDFDAVSAAAAIRASLRASRSGSAVQLEAALAAHDRQIPQSGRVSLRDASKALAACGAPVALSAVSALAAGLGCHVDGEGRVDYRAFTRLVLGGSAGRAAGAVPLSQAEHSLRRRLRELSWRPSAPDLDVSHAVSLLVAGRAGGGALSPAEAVLLSQHLRAIGSLHTRTLPATASARSVTPATEPDWEATPAGLDASARIGLAALVDLDDEELARMERLLVSHGSARRSLDAGADAAAAATFRLHGDVTGRGVCGSAAFLRAVRALRLPINDLEALLLARHFACRRRGHADASQAVGHRAWLQDSDVGVPDTGFLVRWPAFVGFAFGLHPATIPAVLEAAAGDVTFASASADSGSAGTTALMAPADARASPKAESRPATAAMAVPVSEGARTAAESLTAATGTLPAGALARLSLAAGAAPGGGGVFSADNVAVFLATASRVQVEDFVGLCRELARAQKANAAVAAAREAAARLADHTGALPGGGGGTARDEGEAGEAGAAASATTERLEVAPPTAAPTAPAGAHGARVDLEAALRLAIAEVRGMHGTPEAGQGPGEGGSAAADAWRREAAPQGGVPAATASLAGRSSTAPEHGAPAAAVSEYSAESGAHDSGDRAEREAGSTREAAALRRRKAAEAAAARDAARNKSFTARYRQAGTWTCGVCAWVQSERWARECEMCSSANPFVSVDAVTGEAVVRTPTKPVPGMSETGGEPVSAAAQRWLDAADGQDGAFFVREVDSVSATKASAKPAVVAASARPAPPLGEPSPADRPGTQAAEQPDSLLASLRRVANPAPTPVPAPSSPVAYGSLQRASLPLRLSMRSENPSETATSASLALPPDASAGPEALAAFLRKSLQGSGDGIASLTGARL